MVDLSKGLHHDAPSFSRILEWVPNGILRGSNSGVVRMGEYTRFVLPRPLEKN